MSFPVFLYLLRSSSIKYPVCYNPRLLVPGSPCSTVTTVWRDGLLIKASRIGIDGKNFNWLSQFLFERTFVVQVGACQASIYKAENCIPQGSVISPIHFNIMINYLFENVGYGAGCALYADDRAIWKRGRNKTSDFKYANGY